jgi:hypothetical protein
MALPNVEACFFIEEPAELEFRAGMVHVAQQIGGYRFVRVMSPNVFLQGLRQSTEFAKLLTTARVLPFRQEFIEAEVA